MSNALLLLFGLVLLVLQSLVQHTVRVEWAFPTLTLPIVLYMAVGEFSLARGASLAFVLGYFTDAFSGLPMGLYTFSMLTVFLFTRVAGLKLFLHGVAFQMLLTLVASLVVGAMLLALHLLFQQAYGSGNVHYFAGWAAMRVAFAQGVLTALCAPVVFALVRQLPGLESNKPEEA